MQQDFGNPVCLVLFLWAWELSAISPAQFQLLVRSWQLQQRFPLYLDANGSVFTSCNSSQGVN